MTFLLEKGKLNEPIHGFIILLSWTSTTSFHTGTLFQLLDDDGEVFVFHLCHAEKVKGVFENEPQFIVGW